MYNVPRTAYPSQHEYGSDSQPGPLAPFKALAERCLASNDGQRRTLQVAEEGVAEVSSEVVAPLHSSCSTPLPPRGTLDQNGHREYVMPCLQLLLPGGEGGRGFFFRPVRQVPVPGPDCPSGVAASTPDRNLAEAGAGPEY